jgi:hypothetical protein
MMMARSPVRGRSVDGGAGMQQPNRAARPTRDSESNCDEGKIEKRRMAPQSAAWRRKAPHGAAKRRMESRGIASKVFSWHCGNVRPTMIAAERPPGLAVYNSNVLRPFAFLGSESP